MKGVLARAGSTDHPASDLGAGVRHVDAARAVTHSLHLKGHRKSSLFILFLKSLQVYFCPILKSCPVLLPFLLKIQNILKYRGENK